MANKTYCGVNGIARRVKQCYVGVDGVAKRVKKIYVGVDGKAELCYSSNVTITFKITNSYSRSNVINYSITSPNGTTTTSNFSSSSSTSFNVVVEYGSVITILPASINNSNSYYYSVSCDVETVTATQDTTINFTVSRDTRYYYVHFYDRDGKYIASRSTTYGGSITNPPTPPTITGYTFNGWGDLTNITSSKTVYATYSEKKYTVYVTIRTSYGDYGPMLCQWRWVSSDNSTVDGGTKLVSYNGSDYYFSISGVPHGAYFYVLVKSADGKTTWGDGQKSSVTSNSPVTINV